MSRYDPSRREPDYLSDIKDFHHLINGKRRRLCEIGMYNAELRANLIEEEAEETVTAIRAGHFVKAIDGLMDLLVVTFGTIEEFGLDPGPFWDEVHRTNMLKATGPIREDGKRLKPEGWIPPNIRSVLQKQRRIAKLYK